MERLLGFLARGLFPAVVCGLLGISGCDEIGPNVPAPDKPDADIPANDNPGQYLPVNNIPAPSQLAPDLSATSRAYQQGYEAGTDEFGHPINTYLQTMDATQIETHFDRLAEINNSVNGPMPYQVPLMPPKWSAERLEWLKGFEAGLHAAH